MAPTRKKPTKAPSDAGSDDEDYRKKRDRNNQAVKRSRVKSKQRAQETQERVDALKKEIDETEKKLLEKKQRTKFLKELFLDTARSKSETLKRDIDLKKLLEDDDEGTT